MWGEHLHHGYYPKDGPKPTSNFAAQVDMIERVLSWAGITQVNSALDVGCGLGGSSRHLSKKYNCKATGVTLSPYQAQRGNELSSAAGLGENVQLQVADALDMPFPPSSYDLVWSLESGEHMPNKKKFVNELVRVTAAGGGKVIVVTWCHRVLKPGTETELTGREKLLLDLICRAYYLPAWCSVADYEGLFKEAGLKNIKTADWSEEVAPFWGEVIKTAVTVEGVSGLLKSGWTTIKGALVMPLMALGFQQGLIKFVLITGEKE
jgi:tocopherol O-methyltransferase